MLFLYTDETNTRPEQSKFFVYAGVCVEGGSAAALHADIEAVRRRNGYRSADVLKFNTKERPATVTPAVHTATKREVLQAAAKHNVKLFASFVLHRIATKPDKARAYEINRICSFFQQYLKQRDEYGFVFVDQFNDQAPILREKFSRGLVYDADEFEKRLDRVLGFHVAFIGTSHFTSVVDVAIGSLRQVVNTSEIPKTSTFELLNLLKPLLLVDTGGRVLPMSIFFSPMKAYAPLKAEYDKLREFFAAHGLPPLATVEAK